LPRTKKRTHKYLKIVGPDHALVVTVIEILSPSNKCKHDDRERYLSKREDYFAANTSFVEIDLLRDGDRMPMGKPSPPAVDYYVFVCRGGSYPRAGVWPFTVREPIPPFSVPLKAGDPDIRLDLQPCLDDIYDTNRYAMRIDYSQGVTPRFRKLDEEWATELLKKHAKRKKK
jgi:hypothetical protein